MQLFAYGLNHQTAPIEVREKLAFAPEQVESALADLLERQGVREAAIVSTCNRTEVYCNARDPEGAMRWLAEYRQLDVSKLNPFLYRLPGRDAARHAFRVAAGLDSMVLGEAQILGQMKDAVRAAQSAGALGILLNGLFQRAFSVAKEVRTQTAIGANSVSMAAAAVKLAERIFPDIGELAVLFVGAGEMIELTATHFAARKPRRLTIANRTVERGAALAAQFGGEAISLADLPESLSAFDIVVTCTASQLPLIGKGLVERAIKRRKHRPIFMVDLGVPRDIEPEVGRLSDVYLYSVDDLAEIVRQGREERQTAVAAAETIVDQHADDFMHWIDSRALVPTIRDLKDHIDRIRRHELERAHKRLAKGAPVDEVLEAMSQAMAAKFIHAPLATLNEAGASQHPELIELVRRLYHLHDRN
ncbi:glutamyl-tRNA reductase [Parachitinimonas caeni]|uniref:Glutamyl-tRNA reductase n=1 Tax=Parachitinimonas caeni TaxID=3031301 RepID=A0ABT7DS15_9NEIS|nr:glutamyl-tRNA reductase [Parachitinimonas caeni]MDK2122846.1 glutamyl-tRNA reductase [Parachitinimonas caeni]